MTYALVFDLSCITVCFLTYFFYGKDTRLKIITLNLVIFQTISLSDAFILSEYYYLLVATIDVFFVFLSLTLRFNSVPSLIFLASALYNVFSYIEYNTASSVIYNSYETINRVLIIGLTTYSLWTAKHELYRIHYRITNCCGSLHTWNL